MRSEVPPPMEVSGPATIPLKDRQAPAHEAYEKENAAAADPDRVQEQLAHNKLAAELAQLSHGSDFPVAMKELNTVRENLRAPKPPVLEINSTSPHTYSDPDQFNTWVQRRQQGKELTDLPPPMGDKNK